MVPELLPNPSTLSDGCSTYTLHTLSDTPRPRPERVSPVPVPTSCLVRRRSLPGNMTWFFPTPVLVVPLLSSGPTPDGATRLSTDFRKEVGTGPPRTPVGWQEGPPPTCLPDRVVPGVEVTVVPGQASTGSPSTTTTGTHDLPRQTSSPTSRPRTCCLRTRTGWEPKSGLSTLPNRPGRTITERLDPPRVVPRSGGDRPQTRDEFL